MNHDNDVSGSTGLLGLTGLGSRNVLIVSEVLILSLGALGGLIFALVFEVSPIAGESALETAIQVTAGLFAVQLTVVTFVLVFAVDTSIDWPSLRSVVRHSGLSQWLLAGFIGFGLFAFLGDNEAREALTFFCVGVVIAGFIPIKLLFEVTSDRGRDYLLVSDLNIGQGLSSRRLKRTGSMLESATLLHSFTSVFQSSLKEAELMRLESLVRQLTSTVGHGQQTGGALSPTQWQLHLWCMQRVTRAILFGEIRSASATELLGALTASLCRCTIADRRVASRLDSDSEIEAACFLGVTGRFMAWTGRVSARMADMASAEGPSPDPRSFYLYRSLFEASVRSQATIAKQIDPDPPDVFLPANERERSHGLVDPEAGLIWWTLSVDQNGSNPGVYQLAEILTGEKFFGSFGWGYRSVLGEIRMRLEETEAGEEPSPFPVRSKSAQLLNSFGGLGEVSAEALALTISTWEKFGSVGVDARLGWSYTSDPARFARRVRVFCLGPPEFSPDEDGLRLALERVARFTGPSGGGHSSFSAHAFEAASRTLSGTNPAIPGGGLNLVFPRLVPLQERPGAAVLSVIIRCVDFSQAANVNSEFIRRLLESLPRPLLEEAFETAKRIFPGESSEKEPSTQEMVDGVIERLKRLGADLQETGRAVAS